MRDDYIHNVIQYPPLMWGWPWTFDLPSLSKCWVTALAPSCPVWVVLVIKPMALWILGEHTPNWTSSQPSLYLSYNELAWTPLLMILPQLSLLPMNHFSVFPSLCYIRDMIPNVYELFLSLAFVIFTDCTIHYINEFFLFYCFVILSHTLEKLSSFSRC